MATFRVFKIIPKQNWYYYFCCYCYCYCYCNCCYCYYHHYHNHNNHHHHHYYHYYYYYFIVIDIVVVSLSLLLLSLLLLLSSSLSSSSWSHPNDLTLWRPFTSTSLCQSLTYVRVWTPLTSLGSNRWYITRLIDWLPNSTVMATANANILFIFETTHWRGVTLRSISPYRQIRQWGDHLIAMRVTEIAFTYISYHYDENFFPGRTTFSYQIPTYTQRRLTS